MESPIEAERPDVSVVIPTYNRSELLAHTLDLLVRQDLPADRFEVIVADDGSSDDTAEVVRRYADRLRIGYHFQENRGFRAGAARNGGAKLAAGEVLVFLDTGTFVGPGCLSAHLEAHRAGPGRLVLGCSYASNPHSPCTALLDVVFKLSPEEVVAHLADDPTFQDMRHPDFSRVDFDPSRLVLPWIFVWSGNLSLPTADFWAVGGFDEDFRGWGMEDTELGYRLHRQGTLMEYSKDAWGIEAPHERATESNLASLRRNARIFAGKYDDPVPELYWAVICRAVEARALDRPMEDEWQSFLGWTAEVRSRDVVAEVEEATRDLPGDARVAVFGAGGTRPVSWPDSCHLFEFDRELAERSGARNLTGIRTGLADGSVDVVVVTSRLAGPWKRWGGVIEAEARRIGGQLRGPLFDEQVVAGTARP